MSQQNQTVGYLPDERPPFIPLILFALQQIVVMFPATVLVALITGFHVSTTIFASGLATLAFILITGRKIPLYYGSSFSYIAAIASIMSAEAFANYSLNEKISVAQFGIVMSGFVSIIAGLIIKRCGKATIDKVLPPTVTGSISIIIGLSLAGNAMTDASVFPEVAANQAGLAGNMAWIISLVTLFSTIIYSVYLKGKLSQLPILFGLFTGYITAAIIGGVTGIPFITFDTVSSTSIFNLPIFTLPKPSLASIAAIMPIAIATIPESTAHIYQLDIYVNDLAKKKGSKKKYDIEDKLGLNLIGDGIGDIVSGFIGGPAGTNYGENISAMALSKIFSVPVLIAAAIITMIISCFTPLINIVYSIPKAVIGGLSIYLFGVIAAQGITIMMDKKVDMFKSKNLAVIAVILIIGLGGSFGYEASMIPMFGMKFPAIATAAVVGILLNLVLSIGEKEEV
ncbi:MAG: solute carrier family 23 protein [Anaerocolumna aminovalerica]|jgi:uracil permease|uniref:uracil-xanthine permease family protein n=1 Tax=Anaerocolumna aminovalerica TaxID=1527 RepID=UPI000BE3E1E3|nr:solute carrier family 23 protein [Anaerocolumna aminovalerica]MBU5332485.1 xanthine permease [Anaerocolumna aminovalerica]MDU6265297.1 solute carrier family 23 protein [Anaerocolumna aminovalerica]